MEDEIDPLGYRANKDAIKARAADLAEKDIATKEAHMIFLARSNNPTVPKGFDGFSPEERKLRLERLVKLHVYNITMELFVVDGMIQ